MKCIVTGGLGFVGSNLVDTLISQGHNVVVVDNEATGSLDNLNVRANLYNLDIRHNLDCFLQEEGKIDVIFHLAALARIQPSFARPFTTIDVNCMGTVNVLELARKLECKVVYAGSSSFYADPHKNPYAHSKWIGEEHCRMYSKVYGLSTCITRFFNVYGPRHVRNGENACVLGIFERQKIAGQPLTITGTGEQRRDFTSVFDICDGLIAASQKTWEGETFNLGRGSNHSINEVAQMYKPDKVEYIPARKGEAWETLADLTTTREMLGWEPKRDLVDYVNKFLESTNGSV